jgi:hypothetical protein
MHFNLAAQPVQPKASRELVTVLTSRPFWPREPHGKAWENSNYFICNEVVM